MKFVSFKAIAIKETRHLKPLLLALLALELLGLLEWFVTKSPDEIVWPSISMLLDEEAGSGTAVAYFVVGVITAYMLLMRERTQNTLPLLWSLPVPRWQIFIAKISIGMLVNLAILLFGALLWLALLGMGVSSFDKYQFSFNAYFWEILLAFAICLIGIGYGSLAACFRIVGVLMLLIFSLMALYFGYTNPKLEFLNIEGLLRTEQQGAELLLNESGWLFHGLGSFICFILALAVWTRDAALPADQKKSHRNAQRIMWGLGITFSFLFVVGYGAMQFQSPSNTDNTNGKHVSSEREPLLWRETDYYQISYYRYDEEAADFLIQQADEHFVAVRDLLGVEHPEKIIADFTDASTDHLGIAGWRKMRLQRDALYDESERLHVFVHETAHVFAGEGSGRRMRDHQNYTAFFNEGQAEWVSYELLGLESQREALRKLAALAWHRLDVRFDDFVYSYAFRSQYDENLVYALGEAWVSTLAEVCGDEAPGATIRAMGRSNAPRKLRGVNFWRDTLQAIGCDLSSVNGRLALDMENFKPFVNQVPELNAGVRVNGEVAEVTLTLSDTGIKSKYWAHIRLRDNPEVSASATAYETVKISTGESVTVQMPLMFVSGSRFQYQVGLEFLPGERPFFGRWIDGS